HFQLGLPPWLAADRSRQDCPPGRGRTTIRSGFASWAQLTCRRLRRGGGSRQMQKSVRVSPAAISSGNDDPAGRPLPVVAVFVCSLAVALLMSTPYLFQPFVWRNWPWNEVLAGWVEVIIDRVVGAGSIALARVL